MLKIIIYAEWIASKGVYRLYFPEMPCETVSYICCLSDVDPETYMVIEQDSGDFSDEYFIGYDEDEHEEEIPSYF